MTITAPRAINTPLKDELTWEQALACESYYGRSFLLLTDREVRLVLRGELPCTTCAGRPPVGFTCNSCGIKR